MKKNTEYIFPEKNNMIVIFEGKYDLVGPNKTKGRKIFRIVDYAGYKTKYRDDQLCLFDRDIEELIEVQK